MSNEHNEILALEHQLTGAKEAAAVHDMAMRLSKNKDFQKLILDGFCTKECARYAQMSKDVAISDRDQADALGYAQAAGYLRRWLQVINMGGVKAKGDIPSIEAALDECRALEDQPDEE